MLTETSDDTKLADVQDDLDEYETEIYLGATAMRVSWELDDERDRWRHTGEQRPRSIQPPKRREPYKPADSTVVAFFYLVRLGDVDQLNHWLKQHPLDAPSLLNLLEKAA